MILQALTAYYETLVQSGKLEAPGWAPAKVSVALDLGENGAVEQTEFLKTESKRGKKTAVYMVEVHDDERKHIADAVFTMFYTGQTLEDMQH